MNLAILSHGHAHRPGSIRDRGASGTLAGRPIRETDLIPVYLDPLRLRLREHGWQVAETLGDLVERQQRAAELATAHLRAYPDAVVLYLACHLNSGPEGGGPSLMLFDERSRMGRSVAEHVSASLGLLGRAQGAHLGNWTRRAFRTIEGMWRAPTGTCGLCLEPLDLRNPAHVALIEAGSLPRIGVAIADAVAAWADAQAREAA